VRKRIRASLFGPRAYNAAPTRGAPRGACAAEPAPLARTHTRIGDSQKARVGVIVALWVMALLLGFALAG